MADDSSASPHVQMAIDISDVWTFWDEPKMSPQRCGLDSQAKQNQAQLGFDDQADTTDGDGGGGYANDDDSYRDSTCYSTESEDTSRESEGPRTRSSSDKFKGN